MTDNVTDGGKTLAKTAPQAEPPAPRKDSLARLALTLTLVAVVAATALAGANALTKDRIAAARARVKLAGIARVLPKCDNNPVQDEIKVKGPKGNTISVYPCRQKQPDQSSGVVAVAIESDSSKNKAAPYSGLIQVLVGIDARTGKIRTFKRKGEDDVGVVILKHSETPGLGSKAETYSFLKAFAQRDLADKDRTTDGKVWAVKKDNPSLGFVDVISGATITSRAVMEVVHHAMAVYQLRREELVTPAEGQDATPVGGSPEPAVDPPTPPKAEQKE